MNSLAILSGKGGSGKTTLSILLTQLLANCNKQVLLVDCDLSTNGATYFFESRLTEKEKYCTFSGIISGAIDLTMRNPQILHVTPNIDFIPSCVSFPSKAIKNGEILKNNFGVFFRHIKEHYDIVIFDCQAGYSIATDIIIEYTEKNLAVIEADAVSASSLRVLYSQLSKHLDNSTTYQIFNKISSEEKEVYSKLTHETLFTNLNPILFDWNIRRAFVTNDLPDIDYTDFEFANDVCNLAIILFPHCKNNIYKFIIDIKEKMLYKLDKDKEEIKNKTVSIKKTYFVENLLSFLSLTLCGFILVGIFIALFLMIKNNEENFYGMIILLLVLCFPIYIVISFLSMKNRNKYAKEKKGYEKVNEDIVKKQDNLTDEISQLKEKINI